ncbi:MAG TPA: NAD(P)-binding domain-containing protein [Chthoniobacterales bacterium]|jgi:thioredoxin reductase/ferredoxin|nr:NAD(P)-binding domain-containing protein [Chthoniobacterales bacterium]
MAGILSRYTKWLHTQWPAGTVEKLPVSGPGGVTGVPGVRIVGDLTGIPLLKFSSHTGAEAVREIVRSEVGGRKSEESGLDLAIIGAGVAGVSAAIEARKAGLNFAIYEATEIFSTVVNFPKGKPIYTYPTEMELEGGLQFSAEVKEALVEEMETQRDAAGITVTPARVERLEARDRGAIVLHMGGGTTVTARNVIVAIGRSGNFRKLGVPGEELDKVYNRLFDPKEFAGQNALVVGGGDSALETAIALATCGANVTLSYRGKEFSRAKPENIEKVEALVRDGSADVQVEKPTSERVTTAMTSGMRKDQSPGSLNLALGTEVTRIDHGQVFLKNGRDAFLPNDVVFTMLGREAPLDFFRRSGLEVRGDWRPPKALSLGLIILVCIILYHWKKGGVYLGVSELFERNRWFPFNIPDWWAALGPAFANRANILGTLRVTLGEAGFYYSLAYTLCVTLFGIRRIRRRRTPYITTQTLTLMAFQIVPLFFLPYILLPWAGNNGWFDAGIGKTVADALFPVANYGHGREYWRAFGLVLAWPLFIWNVFTEQPMWTWLIISFIQTFVLIPLIIFRWGKGAYCGWICSCGALAETLGDAHRTKMPHGPGWNRFNMLGQVFLAMAFFLLLTRSLAWAMPGSVFGSAFQYVFKEMPVFNYVWFVDLLWAGIIGVGFYWHFSGRVWCRFACPLAALMHIYTRFTRFRIFPEKSKCISCNVCTSVCHQGIDIMNFANKGIPMQDPQCVRCSACVEQCPTGVLAFGRYDEGRRIVLDRIPASPVRMREGMRG